MDTTNKMDAQQIEALEDYLDAMSPNTWLQTRYLQQLDHNGNEEAYSNLDDFDLFDHDLFLDQINKSSIGNVPVDKYSCRCGRKFHTQAAAITCSTSHHDDFIKDTMILDGEKIYPCMQCSYNTNSVASLEKHKTIHANSKAFQCKYCPYSTQFIHVLEHHKTGHNMKRKYQCDKCSYSCNLSEALRRHRAIHELSEPFSCDFCNFKSVLKDVIIRHKVTHKKFRGYICEDCGFHCKNLATLNKHKISHLPSPIVEAVAEVKYPKPFKCEQCPMAFARQDSLSVHVRKHSGESPYCCEECKYTCKDRYSLKKHIKLIHKGVSPLQCSQCSYSTLYKGDLNKHELMHKGDRKFKCDQCPFTGLTLGDLRRHQLTHGGEKKYKCNYCEYSCTRSDYLKLHIQGHTKPFSCSECDYKTTQARNLKSHMLTHSGEKPFSCDDCDYKTRTSKHLQRHIKNHCKVKKAIQQSNEKTWDEEFDVRLLDSVHSSDVCLEIANNDVMFEDSESEITSHIAEDALTRLMDVGTEVENREEIYNECDSVNKDVLEKIGNQSLHTLDIGENDLDREFIEFIENDAESRQIVTEEIIKLMMEGKEDFMRMLLNEECASKTCQIYDGNNAKADINGDSFPRCNWRDDHNSNSTLSHLYSNTNSLYYNSQLST